jgi:hypothetical protein
MQLRLILALFLILPSISFAADCEDTDLFNEQLLSSAVTELVKNYGSAATKQAISSCESGPGARRQIKLGAHEQDDQFTYYRMVNCKVATESSDVACESSEGRRIKYRGTTVDIDNASNDKSNTETQTKNYVLALDCFNKGLQAGTVKTRKYNQLLDTTLDIPLAVDSVINSINLLPGFRRYTINATPEDYRFSVELDKEYGCFIEPLK